MMRIFTILGARPQFIKAMPVSKILLNNNIQEHIIHTGQHYDSNMSKVFFDELGIPETFKNLNIGSGSHGEQTGRMLIDLEVEMMSISPELVIVYGDTNSTLAGALAAAKLNIPTIHIESGLRSFNREMPEEHNRVIADNCASHLCCPTESAVKQLKIEGITENVFFTGDTMYDAVLLFSDIAKEKPGILNTLHLQNKEFILATVHRPYNTDNNEKLENIIEAFLKSDQDIVFPDHPRTKARIAQTKFQYILDDDPNSKLRVVPPIGYLDMINLEKNAKMIITDSGGIQKEAKPIFSENQSLKITNRIFSLFIDV